MFRLKKNVKRSHFLHFPFLVGNRNRSCFLVSLVFLILIGNSFFGCGNRREKIQKLIHELALWQEGDHRGYDRITNALIRIGKPAVPDLIKTLKDENYSNRHSIIYVLSRIRDESVIPVFEELIKKDKDPYIRISAISSLNELSSKTQPIPGVLIDALYDEDANVRENVVRNLANFGPQAVPVLVKTLLEDKEPSVRKPAAWYLGYIGDKSTIPKLKKSLNLENHPGVRLKVSTALVRLGDESALPVVLQFLKHEDASVREDTIWALEEIFVYQPALTSQIVFPLIDSLKDEHWTVRRGAAFLLGRIGCKSAIPSLQDLLKDKLVRSEAKEAINRILQ